MSDVEVRIEFDVEALVKKYNSRAKAAQVILDESVRDDTDEFVRYRTGATAASAKTASLIGYGQIIYDTPYAKATYYNTHNNVTRDVHPNATPLWFEASKKKNLARWKDAVDRIMKGDNSNGINTERYS